MKKFLVFLLIIVLFTVFFAAGCRTKQSPKSASQDKIELVYYRLYDNEEIFAPLIQEFQSKNRNVRISYRKFTDPVEYENLILNELAEGEGPDIFSLTSTNMVKHVKKLIPMPEDMMTTETFQKTFVNVAGDDLIFADADGQSQIYGVPLSVDTLAIFYNKKLYEEKIPSRGFPAATWDELQDDVYKLTKRDNSFERFETAGIAMGRADNISHAADILYLLMLQEGAEFYDDGFTTAIFANNQVGAGGTLPTNLGAKALEFYTGFAVPQNKQYSWNLALSDPASSGKEITTFAKGKVAMIAGYSFTYQQILDQIGELDRFGVSHISKNDIGIALMPQFSDDSGSRESYANYFAEVVSRNTAHPREAWVFLQFLSSKENIAYYGEKTRRPTSRRDLIEEQSRDPLFGVFAKQLGFARSVPMVDTVKYEEIFKTAIGNALD
ncbi:extracellular solute-binding protein, partial [Candidatus Peregrinibacteria bacterium]|nr:extracellular solute-binding protein [Candidatus Peregrinibacteria bacterium]